MGGYLDPYNGQTATADFSHTGIVQVILPEGAAFTSESGVFLTGNGPVVPLPGAVLLVGSGILLMGAAGLRRQRRS